MGHGAGTKLHIMPWEVAQCAAGEMKESERTGSLWWDARFLNNSSSSPHLHRQISAVFKELTTSGNGALGNSGMQVC